MAASPSQRAKVRGEVCIVCAREASEFVAIDPAHVVDRSLGGCDLPDCVVPLCRALDWSCHDRYDAGELDLLPYLEPRHRVEQRHAVGHVGIARAFRRTAPSLYAEAEAA